MSLLKCSDPLPKWSELDFIHIINLIKGEEQILFQKSSKEKIFIGEGICDFFIDEKKSHLKSKDFIELVNPFND